jgi:hypothetical protein
MKRRTFVLALSVLFGVAGLAAISVGGSPRSKHRRPQSHVGSLAIAPQAQPKMPLPMLRPPKFEPEPAPSLSVDPWPGLKGKMLDLHSQAAALLTGANPTPTHRLKHFQWLLHDQRYHLTGWGGFIKDLEAVPGGGYRVTVRVNPNFRALGSSAVTADYTLETYFLSNGQVHFIEGIDPPDAEPGVAATD